MAKKISELTSATAIADADLVVIVQSGSSKKATGAVLKETVLGAVDTAAAQAVIEDANLLSVRDGTDSKSITGLALITSGKDSDFPSYKNLVVKSTVASPNNQIDITFDNLQIGRIHKTSGSYLAFDVATAGNWDTGSAAEPANGWMYVWMMAKIDGTCDPFYSLSATAPTMPSGYVFTRLISSVKNASSNFANFFQYNDFWSYGSAFTVFSSTSTSTVASDFDMLTLLGVPANTHRFRLYVQTNGQASVGGDSTSSLRSAGATTQYFGRNIVNAPVGFWFNVYTSDIPSASPILRYNHTFGGTLSSAGHVVIVIGFYLDM